MSIQGDGSGVRVRRRGAEITVVLVDDHDYVRDALGTLLGTTPDIRVVGECADGTEALETVLRTEPDVVLMDVAMPGMTGLEATRSVLAARPQTRVVMLTGTITAEAVSAARALGVSGYLLKDDAPDELPVQLRAVASGGSASSSAAAARLAGASGRRPGAVPTPSIG